MVNYPTENDREAFREQLKVNETVGNYYVSLIGLREYQTHSLIDAVHNGLSFQAYERFERNIALPKEQVLKLLHIPLRTLQRRKREGSLHPDESDRLLRAARVFGNVVSLFEGDYKAARDWFSSPLQALGDTSPIEMACTELGAREVETVIGRLEYGIGL